MDAYIAQILPDRGKVVDDRNLEFLQAVRWAYPRQLKDLRRPNDTC